jgi:hypothetical protein
MQVSGFKWIIRYHLRTTAKSRNWVVAFYEIYITQIYSLFFFLFSILASLPRETFSACSVHHTPIINAFSMLSIPNEGSSKSRLGEVGNRGVLDIFKLVPVNNSLYQSVALTLEHNEILFRDDPSTRILLCVWNQTCKAGKASRQIQAFLKILKMDIIFCVTDQPTRINPVICPYILMRDIQILHRFRTEHSSLTLLTQFHAHDLFDVITFGWFQQIIRRSNYKTLCEQEKKTRVFLAKFLFFTYRLE